MRPYLISMCSIPSFSYTYRSEDHTSELQSHVNLVCRLLLEKKTSHGGLYAAYLAAKLKLSGEILNDAGVGLDEAGIACLRYLDALSMAAAFFFHDTATTGIYTLSLPGALPI